MRSSFDLKDALWPRTLRRKSALDDVVDHLRLAAESLLRADMPDQALRVLALAGGLLTEEVAELQRLGLVTVPLLPVPTDED